MKLLILFLLVVSTYSKPLFDRACKENPANCVAADFAFTKEYLGRGVCGGMAYQKRKDPAGNDVNILDECGFWDHCQFPEKLDFDCTAVLFQANKDACYEYIGTGTCHYSEQSGWIVGLLVIAAVSLIALIIDCIFRINTGRRIKGMQDRIRLLTTQNTIINARNVNNGKAYVPLGNSEKLMATRF